MPVFTYSCAIASAVLDVIEDEGLMEHAKHVGEHIMDRLRKLQKKHRVRFRNF